MPMNVRTDSSLRGYLFIEFLALILRMTLMRMMADVQLLKKIFGGRNAHGAGEDQSDDFARWAENYH
jgi:hypothetical protein